MIRAHKIRLRPTPSQEQLFWQCVGTARFAYNWALENWKRQYESGEKPNEAALRRQLNASKRADYPWMLDTPKSVVQQAVKNLGTAFGRFFKKQAKYPKFKSRHNGAQTARLDNGPGTFSFDGKSVKLPKIGWVRTFEALRYEGKPLSAVLRREGDRWFLSVTVEIPDPPASENQAAVGLDFGLTTAVTLSNGEKFDAPKPLKGLLRKLARLQRRLSRKVKGSNNRRKAKAKVARLHWHIKQVRYDWQHKLTTMLASRYGTVCLEDLNVHGMMANHRLARAISDIGWYEIKRQLSYKTRIIEVDRWFPSSKLCFGCGHKADKMPMSVREWTCSSCGEIHDRDVNAAKNILNCGTTTTASCAESNACGEDRLLTASRKQESACIV
jgi:putative transposase